MQNNTLPADHTAPQCSYAHLLADLAYYATGVWELTTEHCTRPATHYMCIELPAIGDITGEEYRNICATHEPQVRALPGWRWSRVKKATDGAR